MSRLNVSFESLERCTGGDIIRINYQGDTRWAVVGSPSSPIFWPIVILSGKDSPFVINLNNDGGLKFEFEVVILKYGSKADYAFVPDYTGRCDIGDGPLFEQKDSLIRVDDKLMLSVFNRTVDQYSKQLIFFDFNKLGITTQRVGNSAAFANWHIEYLKGDPRVLLERSGVLP